MLPRHRYSGLVCGLALLLAGARASDEMGPEMRQALRAVKTVRVEVKQEYDLQVEEAGEMAGEDTGSEDKSAGTKEGEDKPAATRLETAKVEDKNPAGETPEEKFSLPLAGLAEEAVRLAGWKLAGPGEAAELILSVDIQGTPVGANYIGTLAGYFYTGAELQGSVRLELGGKVVAEAEVSAEIPVAPSVHSSSMFGFQGGPRDAPFRETLPEYCEAVFTVIGRACGPGPVLAGLKLENDDQRTGAGRALLTVGDDSVGPALIEITGQGPDTLSRIAALGLGVHGRAAALPALLALLRKDKSDTMLANEQDPSDHELVGSLTEDPDGILPPADRAAAARRMMDSSHVLHRAVEWALLQIESPDKFGKLTAALQAADSVMLRRGAAVVLGNLADRRAFEPLATATRDKEPLVRAAAVVALGRLKEEPAADVILAASDDAAEYVSRLAREQLKEAGEKRWEKFLQSRRPAGANPGGDRAASLSDGFTHPDPLVRAAAARAIGHHPDPEIKAGLARLLRSDPRALVREAAVESLAAAGDDGNAPLLAAALGDTDAAIRRRTVEALTGYFEGEEDSGRQARRSRLPETALAPVLALLARAEVDESAAAILLERIEGPDVADKLLQALQEDHPPGMLRVIARRLAARADKRAVTPLLALLGKAGDAYASQFVADALVTLDDPAMLEPLFAQLRSGTLAARRLAMNVLGRVRQPRAVGPLIAAYRAAENTELGGELRQTLVTLTGKPFGGSEEWMRWWKENAGRPIELPPPEKPATENAPPEEPAGEKTDEPKGNH